MHLDHRLLHLLRGVRAPFALGVILSLGAGLLLVAQAYLLAQIVSRVFLDGQGLADVRGLLIALLIIALARAGMLWGSEAAAHHAAGQIKTDLRERLFAHLIALGPAYTRGERSGELANTATNGIEALDAYFSQYLPQLALAALVPLATLIVVFPLDVLSGVVLLVTAPLIPFFMILIGSMADRLTRRQWTQLSRLSAHFLDVLQGLPTLKLFGQSRAQIAIIRRVSEQFRDTTMSVLRVAFLSALALELLATLSTAIIAVEIGLRLLYGHITFDEAFFILVLAPEFYLPLRLLGSRFHAGMSGAAAAARIFDVLEISPAPQSALELAPPSIQWRGDLTGDGFPLSAVQGGGQEEGLTSSPASLHFDSVYYAYEDRLALNGVTFTIPAGQRIALVGPSGSGKSTIAQVLLRFITPAAGHITVNGRDLADIPPDTWRAAVAWVPQMPYLFAASVADNIRLGRPDAPIENVIRAAQQAHADDFIRALPGSYDTPIGERGARLSGGQAQRIALARAFFKDAPLLILDEATANLDPDTEALIQDAINALLRDRTALIIAHRLNTIQAADQIVVLDRGTVAETGAHADLIAASGPYSRLVNAHAH